MSEDSFLFKDCINRKVIKELSLNIKSNYKYFDSNRFEKSILKDITPLSLTERLDKVTDFLYDFLPKKYEQSVSILLKSLPPELPNSSEQTEGSGAKTISTLNGMIMLSLTSFISRYGLEHFEQSTHALYEMTKRFSSEGAMRYFILQDQKKTMRLLLQWTDDKNMHVRRLCSETTRPRLPWAIQLKPFIKNPKPIFKILDQLYQDDEIYVRRSVANNLNDISKDNPELVINTLKKWMKKTKTLEMKWLTNHALRTLLKQGNSEALNLIGYSSNFKVKISNVEMPKARVKIGSKLNFEVNIHSLVNYDQDLMIDYIIHHQKANGSLTPKVFKWKKLKLKANENKSLKKDHSFKIITTRVYHPGDHQIQMQINGKQFKKFNFILTK
ncbi:DNA alkylation repair protein [Bacteriovoracaceae bacterium]|nr:DNA alkylation repair protein [Bacteriovoracaceae bacterium]